MSFRTRLTSFFVLIVVVPMVAVAVLFFRLISDSQSGKTAARATGVATAAGSVYQSERLSATNDARVIARDPRLLAGATVRPALAALAAQSGLARATVSAGGKTIASVGDPTAIAPGSARIIRGRGRPPLTVTASEITAAQFARELSAPGVKVIIRQGRRTLAATARVAGSLPPQGDVTVNGAGYRFVTVHYGGFGGQPVSLSVLSAHSLTSSPLGVSRVSAAVLIVVFLLLAFGFSMLASRALQGQLAHFLHAARRLGSGDFSSPIQVEGNDEFAALGQEFNSMASQLASRLDEVTQGRARLRESIHRIGETFAANLDRPALLTLALKTALDAVNAGCGRLTVRAADDDPLTEACREGSLAGLEEDVLQSERIALQSNGLGEVATDELSVVSVPLGPLSPGGKSRGVVTVARRGQRFNDDDREILRSLAGQATLALDNVELHFQVQRQAVTDELTGLANHGRFQELLSSEMDQVRRYQYPVGLIMLDIDNFKSINDTHGHQQGDIVLKHVARVLRENSREADSPARYGGEEMALILPHTDLEGSYAIAERVRSAVEELRIPRTDQQGILRATASVGVAASTEGEKDALIAEADAALYDAKRQGKNRTIKATRIRAANAVRSG